MNINTSWSSLLSSLGGAAGVAGVICTLLGATPSSAVGKAVEGIVSGALVLIAHWHLSSTTASAAKAAQIVPLAPVTTTVRIP